ncbi:tetratricopeptide repeat protein [Polaribacter sp. Asnod1-A03]|uniref:tetratricopeptide repeat-containing sensor histidine kinase n=1 Tax=Polaribacter sp. Asnod1-A03 TaxID=3160581 RepID=UPI0038641661
MKKSIKLIIILVNIFTLQEVKSYEFNKKEALLNKVSFLLNVISDTVQQKKYLHIEKLYNENKYDTALEQALPFLKLNLNNQISFKVNFIVAEIYRKSNNYKLSIKYFKEALKVIYSNEKYADGFNDGDYKNTEIIRSYLKLGNLYLRLEKIDSAKYFYNKSMSLNVIDDKPLSYQASASSNLSGIYLQDSLYDLAKEYAISAVAIHKKRNNKISEASALGNLASIYLELQDYSKAKSTYKEALDLIKNKNDERALRVKEDLYYNFAYNLYKLKDYEAYKFQERSYDIKDTLRDVEVRKIIEELGFKHNFESQKASFDRQKEVQLLKERDKVRSSIMVGVFLLISLLVVIGYSSYRQKNLLLELTQSELLQNQKLDKLKSETQARVLDATLNGREVERKEIAEILHDNVSALLSSANLHLQATSKQFNGTEPIEINKTKEIIKEASHKIRDLSHTLVSSVLLKFGLNFAVRDIAEKYSNSDLYIDVKVKNLRRYNQRFEIKTYNIIQEFVNNILKHSKAKTALIKVKEEKGVLFIKISDDGIGFDKTKTGSKLVDGLGINQIEARIHMMKGKLMINSIIGEGTKIEVELPVQEKEEPNFS